MRNFEPIDEMVRLQAAWPICCCRAGRCRVPMGLHAPPGLLQRPDAERPQYKLGTDLRCSATEPVCESRSADTPRLSVQITDKDAAILEYLVDIRMVSLAEEAEKTAANPPAGNERADEEELEEEDPPKVCSGGCWLCDRTEWITMWEHVQPADNLTLAFLQRCTIPLLPAHGWGRFMTLHRAGSGAPVQPASACGRCSRHLQLPLLPRLPPSAHLLAPASFVLPIAAGLCVGLQGFKLIFRFSENPYFSNAELTKTYYMLDEEDPVLERPEGTQVNWKDGKNPTIKVGTRIDGNAASCVHGVETYHGQ